MDIEKYLEDLFLKKEKLEEELFQLTELNNECITERLAARDPYDEPGADEIERSKRIEDIRLKIKTIIAKINDLQ